MKKYIVVGYGNHARGKIIPLLKELNLLKGVVTRKAFEDDKLDTYKNLEEACNIANNQTTFLICSPPKYHYKQANFLIRKNFNFLIEKPIFIKKNEFIKIYSNLNKNNFFNELLMYKHNDMYSRFIKIWSKYKIQIKKIDITFVIPSFANDSFRSERDISSSLIFDVGYYPISLLNELKIDLSNIELKKVSFYGNPRKEFFYISLNDKIKSNIRIGIKKKYKNEVKIHLHNGDYFTFEPFFHGMDIKKMIKKKINKKESTIHFKDKNAFKNMFMLNRKYWKEDIKRNHSTIIDNLSIVQKIISQYKKRKFI